MSPVMDVYPKSIVARHFSMVYSHTFIIAQIWGNIQCIVIFIYPGFIGYPQVWMLRNISYTQVYPQIDLTDYIIRQSRSGALWRVVEDRALLTKAS
jgi:hypothetical protein